MTVAVVGDLSCDKRGGREWLVAGQMGKCNIIAPQSFQFHFLKFSEVYVAQILYYSNKISLKVGVEERN